jgi:alkanesulfonate monooxygenase SsuD/methylene tetrahydromethanopterin reductase-like flavin-dependent oxidoreductase (luciferase family)
LSFGVAAVCKAGGSRPGEVAAACEENGFDVLLFPEHSHVPQGPALPRPSGPPVGRDYIDIFDSVVSTALALAATTRLRAGPGVAVLTQRDPIYFAKEIASLDVLSDGRVVIGVGAGWNASELRNHGVEHTDRMHVLESKLRLVRDLLSADPGVLGRLHGIPDDVRDVGSVFGPPSVQQPCPPILVGGESRATLALVVRHGLRWMPSCTDAPALIGRIRRVRDGEYGESTRDVRITVYGLPPEETLLEELLRLDVDQVVFRLEDTPSDRVPDQIGKVAQLIGCAA